MKYENQANVFKALCDPNRLLIIEILQSGEKCACKLLEDLNISQSTLSHHMKILCEAGFVDSNRQGKWMHYTIHREFRGHAQRRCRALPKQSKYHRPRESYCAKYPLFLNRRLPCKSLHREEYSFRWSGCDR